MITDKRKIDKMLRHAPYQPGDKVLFSPINRGVTIPIPRVGTITRLAFSDNKILYYIENNPYDVRWIKYKIEMIPRRQLKY
jgi:hypothetical protein